MELLLQATWSKDHAHRLEPTRRYRDRLCCCKCSVKLLNPVALKRGGRRARARRVGIARRAERSIPTRLARLRAGLGDLPFSRGGGARGTRVAQLWRRG